MISPSGIDPPEVLRGELEWHGQKFNFAVRIVRTGDRDFDHYTLKVIGEAASKAAARLDRSRRREPA